jgi:hypothetical protein
MCVLQTTTHGQHTNTATTSKLTKQNKYKRLVFFIKGPAAAALCEVPPTPQDILFLQTKTLDAVLDELKSANEVFSRGAASGFRGVSFDKRKGKWLAQCGTYSAGTRETSYHDTDVDAAHAYDAMALRIHGP